MKALKSERARKILTDKTATDNVRAAIEFVVSSKPKGANKQAPIITYKDNNGELRHVRVEVVSVM